MNNVLRKFDTNEFRVEYVVGRIVPEEFLCKLQATCEIEGKEVSGFSNEKLVIKEKAVSYSQF